MDAWYEHMEGWTGYMDEERERGSIISFVSISYSAGLISSSVVKKKNLLIY